MTKKILFLIICLFAFSLCGCGSSSSNEEVSYYDKGYASFYDISENGSLTTSEERYERSKLTASHRTLPYGTKVKVTNLNNGRNTVVTINDHRMPEGIFIIKLSEKAATELATDPTQDHEFSLHILNWG